MFIDCSIREYFDEELQLKIDRDISCYQSKTSRAGLVPDYKPPSKQSGYS
ncbi:hypothetical protein [Okeania sp. SIO3I5]|nr:hypothetical protein [Okeania sp. SIO3I5]